MDLNRALLGSALAVITCGASAHAVADAYNYVEGRIGVASADLSQNPVDLSTDGPGGGASLRLPIEGNWFFSADGYISDTDGSIAGVRFDVESTEYRAGFGAVNLTLDGKAAVAARVEYVRLDLKISSPGMGSEKDTAEGVAAHLRLDSINRTARVHPYIEIGYVSLSDADGPEALLGVSIDLAPFDPFVEYRFTDLDIDTDGEYEASRFSAGVRFTF